MLISKKSVKLSKRNLMSPKTAGMTQKELARQARKSQAAISRLESGTYRKIVLIH